MKTKTRSGYTLVDENETTIQDGSSVRDDMDEIMREVDLQESKPKGKAEVAKVKTEAILWVLVAGVVVHLTDFVPTLLLDSRIRR